MSDDPYRAGQAVAGKAVCASRSARHRCDGAAHCVLAKRAGGCGAVVAGDPCPCPQPPMTGRQRCYNHGGTTPRGLANANTRSGITSADFPTRMRARVEAMLTDPDLLSLHGEAAGLSARGVDILARVDSGEAGRLWQRLQAAKRELRAAQADLGAAQRAEDKDAIAKAQATMREALDALLAAVDAGSADWAAWQEWLTVVEAKRKVVETASRIAERRDYMIPADQVLLMLVALADLGRQHIDDPAVRNRYAREASVVIEGLRARVPADPDGALTG